MYYAMPYEKSGNPILLKLSQWRYCRIICMLFGAWEGDADFALRWSLIKAEFSPAIPKTEVIRRSRKMKRERGIWQQVAVFVHSSGNRERKYGVKIGVILIGGQAMNKSGGVLRMLGW
jgi:hypothetical protein